MTSYKTVIKFSASITHQWIILYFNMYAFSFSSSESYFRAAHLSVRPYPDIITYIDTNGMILVNLDVNKMT
jgi:hypothetical protein